MTHGQFIEGATCPDCNTALPVLRDDRGWGIATCPKCGKGFDTDDYRAAGGIFHTGTGCKCERCSGLEG